MRGSLFCSRNVSLLKSHRILSNKSGQSFIVWVIENVAVKLLDFGNTERLCPLELLVDQCM